jgi:hypothetical protein
MDVRDEKYLKTAGSIKGTDHLGDLVVVRSIIAKWILDKQCVRGVN